MGMRNRLAVLMVLVWLSPALWADPEQADVLLVTEENLYFQTALGVNREARLDIIAPDELAEADLDAYDLVVFDRVTFEEAPMVNALYVGCVPPGVGLELEEVEGHGDLKFDHVYMPHPLFGGIRPHMLINSDASIADRTVLSHDEDAVVQVIGESEHGVLVAEAFLPGRTALIVSFDVNESSWVITTSFLVFTLQSTAYLQQPVEADPIERLVAQSIRDRQRRSLFRVSQRHLLDLARQQLGEDFVPSVLETFEQQPQLRDTIATGLRTSYRESGDAAVGQAALAAYGVMIADADEQAPEDEGALLDTIKLRVFAAILAERLDEHELAVYYKHGVETRMRSRHVLGGAFPVLDEADRAVYQSIEIEDADDEDNG